MKALVGESLSKSINALFKLDKKATPPRAGISLVHKSDFLP